MNKQELAKSAVFRGMSDDEINAALKALSATKRKFSREEMILMAGDSTDKMGLVLEGSVRIESNDIWGNRTILSIVEPGHVFAETYALVKEEPLLVDAVANQDCKVLMLRVGILANSTLITDRALNIGNALTNVSKSMGSGSIETPSWRYKLMANLLNISIHKNLILSGRSFHTSPKSIRGRVMAYLSSVSLQQGKREFDIPFDRQQLADYLNLDRTALSKELGKMQRDGIIRVKKSHFKLISE